VFAFIQLFLHTYYSVEAFNVKLRLKNRLLLFEKCLLVFCPMAKVLVTVSCYLELSIQAYKFFLQCFILIILLLLNLFGIMSLIYFYPKLVIFFSFILKKHC